MVEQGIWRIRTNRGFRDLYKDPDMVADITKKSLELVGQVVRMGQARIVKEIFESKSEGRRRTGKPRLRRMEDVGKDLREMKVKRWRHKAVDREEWESVIK